MTLSVSAMHYVDIRNAFISDVVGNQRDATKRSRTFAAVNLVVAQSNSNEPELKIVRNEKKRLRFLSGVVISGKKCRRAGLGRSYAQRDFGNKNPHL